MKIKSITVSDKQPVYDISVASSENTFLANGISVHNCGRISRIGTVHSNLNIWIPMHEASNDLDCYNYIFGQVAFIYRLNPQLVDEGLYDATLDELEEKEADLFLAKSLKNRKARYIK